MTAGQSTVAVRMPSHPIAKRLIQLCNFPLAAPSANLSGGPSPTMIEHVEQDLNDRISCIVNSGPCISGVESTVLSLMQDPPIILRPGGVTLEMLTQFVPNIQVYYPSISSHHNLDPRIMSIDSHAMKSLSDAPMSPGMKYVHYAPKAKLVLIRTEKLTPGYTIQLERFIKDHSKERGIHIGILLTANYSTFLSRMRPYATVFHLGSLGESEDNIHKEDFMDEIARDLFAGLRYLDAKKVHLIFMETLPSKQEGLAVMNRISKAASLILPVNSVSKVNFTDDTDGDGSNSDTIEQILQDLLRPNDPGSNKSG